MNKIRKIVISSLLFVLVSSTAVYSQLIDGVTAIIGDESILLSELESMVLSQRSQGNKAPMNELRCEILEDLMVQKLFLDQARIDSIEVTQDRIDRELDSRLTNFIMSAGSEEALEEYYHKSMIEIKRDLRKIMANEILTGEVQQTIAMDISISPSEVRKYFSKVPADSLPVLPAEVEISIIEANPPNLDENNAEVRQKLLDLRKRIIEGESFKALAILYSEDEGSARMGGDLGFVPRSNLDKAYANEAFGLKKNAVSRIVESIYGFHIIELIERNGDLINTRHILMRPKVKPNESQKAIHSLDSIADYIRKDSISFELAAKRFSTHKDSRMNGGKFVDPQSRSEMIIIDKLPPDTYKVVRDMNVGEISDAFQTTDDKEKTVFRIVRLDSQTSPHKANMKDDFNYLREFAMNNKRAEVYQEWILDKMSNTYVKISQEFKTCKFSNKGWLK